MLPLPTRPQVRASLPVAFDSSAVSLGKNHGLRGSVEDAYEEAYGDSTLTSVRSAVDSERTIVAARPPLPSLRTSVPEMSRFDGEDVTRVHAIVIPKSLRTPSTPKFLTPPQSFVAPVPLASDIASALVPAVETLRLSRISEFVPEPPASFPPTSVAVQTGDVLPTMRTAIPAAALRSQKWKELALPIASVIFAIACTLIVVTRSRTSNAMPSLAQKPQITQPEQVTSLPPAAVIAPTAPIAPIAPPATVAVAKLPPAAPVASAPVEVKIVKLTPLPARQATPAATSAAQASIAHFYPVKQAPVADVSAVMAKAL